MIEPLGLSEQQKVWEFLRPQLTEEPWHLELINGESFACARGGKVICLLPPIDHNTIHQIAAPMLMRNNYDVEFIGISRSGTGCWKITIDDKTRRVWSDPNFYRAMLQCPIAGGKG